MNTPMITAQLALRAIMGIGRNGEHINLAIVVFLPLVIAVYEDRFAHFHVLGQCHRLAHTHTLSLLAC